jgi:predicted naringenin-chalcone synthase
MRFINDIFCAQPGDAWTNARLLVEFERIIGEMPLADEEHTRLRDFLRFQLVGERTRYTLLDDWSSMNDFRSRAVAFEEAANRSLDALAGQIIPAAEAAGVTFDAVVTTTASGNLMPGLSYRTAHRMPGLVRPNSLMVDLGNVGCTGSIKALNLVQSLDASVRNVLVIAVEVPSTMVDTTGTGLDMWQGNCTFGDGAAAMWVSDNPEVGSNPLALEELRFWQRADTGLELIRWAYRNYYSFALADQKTFDRDVRDFVTTALGETEAGWKNEPRWAIHPAGLLLLMKISRRLGIPGEAIQPSAAHYREYSNMSSASIVHVLKDVAGTAAPGEAINLLTMGAGFNILYGRARRL